MNIRLGQAYSFHQLGQRGNQEDARWPDTDKPSPEQRFFVVCDGVGGNEGGEIASQTVCESFGASLSLFNLDENFSNEDFSQCLDRAYDSLDKAAGRGNHDMATTLTLAVFHGGGCTLAHIGDSRIYHVRPSEGIIYRSDDHSLVNQMVHSGIITPEEAERHPQRNVITRYMGPVAEDQSRCMATVLKTKDIEKGDYFLLCTDGVLHNMSDEQILNLLRNSMPDEQKMREMAQRCADSSDNNTACLIRVDDVAMDEDEVSHALNEDSNDTRKASTEYLSIEEIESVQQPHKEGVFSRIIKRIFQ